MLLVNVSRLASEDLESMVEDLDLDLAAEDFTLCMLKTQCLPALISLDMFIVQVYHAANADLNAALNIKAAGQAVLACGEAA